MTRTRFVEYLKERNSHVPKYINQVSVNSFDPSKRFTENMGNLVHAHESPPTIYHNRQQVQVS